MRKIKVPFVVLYKNRFGFWLFKKPKLGCRYTRANSFWILPKNYFVMSILCSIIVFSFALTCFAKKSHSNSGQVAIAMSKIQEAIVEINGLDSDVFKKNKSRGKLTKYLNKAIKQLSVKRPSSPKKINNALKHLAKALRSTDGCALKGRPDKKDLITDCNAQGKVCPLILEAIVLVKGLSKTKDDEDSKDGDSDDEDSDDKRKYKIEWIPKQVNISAKPGETGQINIQFESKRSISNAVLHVVPKLQPFISVSPVNFADIDSGTKYSVSLNVSIPVDAETGKYYEGTVHLRMGKRTIPVPLKVNLTIEDNGGGIDYDGDGYTIEQGDCNDNDAAINPGIQEACDGVDNNCNGQIDEGVTTTYYEDSDGDGFGNPTVSINACSQPVGHVTDSTDCNDADAKEHPNQAWYKDADNDGYSDGTSDTVSCTRPVGYKIQTELTSISGDCNDNDVAINPEVQEICDGVDNNCDGQIDEGVTTAYYQDSDGDGFGNPTAAINACTQPAGYVTDNTDCNDADPNEHPNQTWYKDADNDGYSDGTIDTTSCTRPAGYKVQSELTAISGDCNDNDAAINLGVQEICDGVDNNCDGQIDEGVTNIYYEDVDGDGFGNLTVSVNACSQPAGHVTDNTDCNDADPNEHPNQAWYKDADNDGYSDGTTDTASCTRPVGYRTQTELTAASVDCDDNNASIYPGVQEACDGIDNNCDGQIDEGVTNAYYEDLDGDGFGNPTVTTETCNQPTGYVADNTDCDDSDPNVNPGATEIPYNGKDEDCNPATPDDDLDGDGHANAVDCNDNDAAINPLAQEVCDSVDNNCDGQIDEGVTTVFYQDSDGDGYGNLAVTTEACDQPAGYVSDNTDCDDYDLNVNPVATEVPYNGKDDDCNPSTPDDDIDGDGYANAVDCNDNDASISPGAVEIPYDGIDQDCNGTDLIDVDVDGHVAVQAGGSDCDDNNASINPNAYEIPYNRK